MRSKAVATGDELLKKILRGDRSAVARAISIVENGSSEGRDVLTSVFPHTGKGYRIGITGPPGAGKSTIANKLARFYRNQVRRVGIIAVDPTSPFTGGALLGDRVRMTDVELDAGVFVRSMASRGSLGGLSKKTSEAADILDAAGSEIVILETVGVGQSELDIARAADTTVVVLVPESGDSIQAMKAGLMEIADFVVLNKADRPGADQGVASIQMVLRLKPTVDGWSPEVVKSVASEGRGIGEIAGEIQKHRDFLQRRGLLKTKRQARLLERTRELVNGRLQVDFWSRDREALLVSKVDEILSRHTTPYEVAEELFTTFRRQKKAPSKMKGG